jgi:secondary thiamine-phosphate synthase enzyme
MRKARVHTVRPLYYWISAQGGGCSVISVPRQAIVRTGTGTQEVLPLTLTGVEISAGESCGKAMDMSYQQQISINTKGHGDMRDITDRVATAVNSSGVKTGIVNVFNVGSTAAVGTIEFEPGLRGDMPAMLDKLIPPSRGYGHEQTWHDGNGHSHLQATLLGPSLSVPIADGKLVLGTWQQIFHLECDVRGRQRTIVVTIVGE